MLPSSAFYKATHAVGHGIATAFNWASGETALRKRGLERCSESINAISDGGAALLAIAGTVTGIALVPVLGPLAAAFAGACAGTLAGFTPAGIQAHYIIRKNKNKKNKTQEAGAKNA